MRPKRNTMFRVGFVPISAPLLLVISVAAFVRRNARQQYRTFCECVHWSLSQHCNRGRITHMHVVPSTVQSLLAARCHCWRCCYILIFSVLCLHFCVCRSGTHGTHISIGRHNMITLGQLSEELVWENVPNSDQTNTVH